MCSGYAPALEAFKKAVKLCDFIFFNSITLRILTQCKMEAVLREDTGFQKKYPPYASVC